MARKRFEEQHVNNYTKCLFSVVISNSCPNNEKHEKHEKHRDKITGFPLMQAISSLRRLLERSRRRAFDTLQPVAVAGHALLDGQCGRLVTGSA